VSAPENLEQYLKDHICFKPWDSISIEPNGDVINCCMPWLPKPIGNLFENTMEEILNSEASREVQESILDGSYRYCNKDMCSEIYGGRLPARPDEMKLPRRPYKIRFNNDRSCNLWCPSCRLRRVQHNEGPAYEKAKWLNDRVYEYMLEQADRGPVEIWVTGSGDAIGSRIYRDMLKSINGAEFPDLKINLMTNGVLFTPKTWESLHRIWNNITLIDISVDAGTKSVYQKMRPPGKWDQLLSNAKYLGECAQEYRNIDINYGFVVQHGNYKDMVNFVDTFSQFERYHLLNFTLVNDWNTWEDFGSHAVWRRSHPEHEEFLEMVRRPELEDERVFMGSLKRFL